MSGEIEIFTSNLNERVVSVYELDVRWQIIITYSIRVRVYYR